ncbi:ATP-binding protein [Lachnoclostridium pacaense]|uniref:AAA family ATPase n=1 Tax=Enterocloster hominis (ex Hitch et al. 2024) TaxID=1917870 RepID=UPI001D12292D|nr:ATP-binding protein [Lachnoclostridium pacaense]MCC2875221.1 ATP-binding protein [Lachnoclostridium pacaense]
MLKAFKLRNYKNFKDEISINFEDIAGYQFSTDCISDGILSKMIIYGRNATGKTNLGNAIMDITKMLFQIGYKNEDIFINADATEDFASFSYSFQFDNNEIIYRYTRFSNFDLRDEELIIDGISIYKCSFYQDKYNFDNLKFINAETASIGRYLQSLDDGNITEDVMEFKLPFLRWIINNTALKNDSLLIKMSEFIRRMTMLKVSNTIMFGFSRFNDSFFESLEAKDNLEDFEQFLNTMGIKCKLVLKKLPDGQRELYFSHDKLIPFYKNASSGTLALTNLYRRFVSTLRSSSFVYLDEFDAFYHYEMAENVIKFFKRNYPKCQIIMTSHNTNLMTNRLMRPDCLFILSSSGTLTALCNATLRELREGHNLEKMYIAGEFEKYE